MIDSLPHFLPIAQKWPTGEDLGLKNGVDWHRFAVLTMHRPSKVDATEKRAELLGAIDSIAAQIPVIPFIRALSNASPRPASRLILN